MSSIIHRALLFFFVAGFVAGTGQAQVFWQTTHSESGGFSNGACGLTRGSLRVKVFPAFLQVEEEVEIAALGTAAGHTDPNTLEINASFSLPPGSAITGALLWDGDRVLSGTLQDKVKADSLYEDLVHRNSLPPPRPRDPLLLQLTGPNTYNAKIYPVKIGHSRRLRLSYQLSPAIGAAGLELNLRGALLPLFDGASQVLTSFENGGGAERIVLLQGGSRTELQLPRTRFLSNADLGQPNQYYNWETGRVETLNAPVKILPIDPHKQVMVKTAFASGLMQGNYINLYAGVTDEMLGALVRRIEVVVLWKWHNPGLWITKDRYGVENISNSLYEAQNQAAQILDLYKTMGSPATQVGLLHDDSRSAPHAFPVAARGQAAYGKAVDYLESVQGPYVESFVRGIKAFPSGKPANVPVALRDSKNRFLDNLKLVKSLFSPQTGTVRHILMVSAGTDYQTEATDMNEAFDSLFREAPVTVSSLYAFPPHQAGFDFGTARRTHSYKGALASNPWAELPALEAVNLTATVRSGGKAYDFPIKCQGGLDLACESLTFHGKSQTQWQDSLEWEAFDVHGKSLAHAKTLPQKIENAEDTAIAVLWAGSESPFSENKQEPALGPVYGFVDRWASILAVPKDSVKSPAAYADSGVPRLDNREIIAQLQNYEGGANPGNTTGIIDAKLAFLGDPASWRIERTRGGQMLLRIAGLAAGARIQIELFDLSGKRVGYWAVQSEPGLLRLDAGAVRPGAYLLKLKAGNFQGVKRIAL